VQAFHWHVCRGYRDVAESCRDQQTLVLLLTDSAGNTAHVVFGMRELRRVNAIVGRDVADTESAARL
jgi:hypothetical protein